MLCRFFLALLCVSVAPAAQEVRLVSTLRVMSYNIHHGEGLDQKVDLERIAAVILEARADIVGLQEVDQGVARTAKRDLPAELAKLTGMTAHFENNFNYQGGSYGNAVLTRFPIKRAKNTHYKMLRTGEQRGALQLLLDVRGRDVLFVTTHIDYRPDDAERVMNVAELKAIVAAATQDKLPVIMVGDFNATPESRTIAHVKAFMTDTWERLGQGDGFTYPVRKSVKRIDYVFITPETLEPMAMQVIHSEASDHLPVVAQLRLK